MSNPSRCLLALLARLESGRSGRINGGSTGNLSNGANQDSFPPGPAALPWAEQPLHNALRRLNLAGESSSIGPITPEKIRVASLGGEPLKGGIRPAREIHPPREESGSTTRKAPTISASRSRRLGEHRPKNSSAARSALKRESGGNHEQVAQGCNRGGRALNLGNKAAEDPKLPDNPQHRVPCYPVR
jgi:hypothetical protein